MDRFVRGCVVAALVAGFLGVASQSLAAGKIECSIMKDGKQTTRMVETKKYCEELGGKVVTSTAKHTTSQK